MNEEQKDVTDVNEVNPEEISETGGMSKKRKIITGVIAGALVLCIAGGTALYVHNKNGEKAVKAAAIEKEVEQAPVVKLYSDSFVVGVNKEINLQEKVMKSITSKNKIKSVTLEMVDSSKKDILAVADIKDGKEKSGVPAKTVKFTKEGKYSVNIVVTDIKNITVKTKVSFEVGAELLSYVQGIKDWSVEVKATTVDYMAGVTFDKDHVKSVSADSSKVDLSKEGTYPLIYKIVGTINNEEVTVEKEVKVKVMTLEDAKKEADKGKQVVSADGKVVVDSKGKVPTGEVSSDKSSNSTVDTPTGGNSNNVATKPSQPESKPEQPSKPESKPEKPSHTHNYVQNFETVNVPAVTHQEDQGHMETKVITEAYSYYEPNLQIRDFCNTCGKDVTGFGNAHMDEHWVNDGITSGWGERQVDVGGQTINVPAETQDVWVPNIVTVVDSPATTKQVPTNQSCSCGSTR